jgi:2-(1,2-epoxy-1,2-dihydrophenyl)acetyl-CoA isomerase
MDEVRRYALHFTAGASLAIELTRRGLYHGLESDFRSCLEWEQFAQNITVRSKDFREAAQAFFEKREPHFEGQ